MRLHASKQLFEVSKICLRSFLKELRRPTSSTRNSGQSIILFSSPVQEMECALPQNAGTVSLNEPPITEKRRNPICT